MRNFIAYFQKGGDFLKSYRAKWPHKQVVFFHGRTLQGRVQHLHLQIYNPCINQIKSYSHIHRPRRQQIPKLSCANWVTIQLTVKAWSHLSQGSNAHEQCVTHCPVFQLVDLPCKGDYVENFHPGNRETQNWDPRLLGWFDCHISAKVDFCCFYLRCHVFCFYRQILCPLLNLTDFSKLPSAHTKFQFSLSTSSYRLLLIKWSFGPIHVLLIQIVSKTSEKQS